MAKAVSSILFTRRLWRVLVPVLFIMIGLYAGPQAHAEIGYPLQLFAAKKHCDASEDDLTQYHFFCDYVRVYVDTVYMPGSRHRQKDSFFINVRTLNKTPLSFPYPIEPKERQVFSARGEYLVVPFVALNTKAPLEITLERRTQKDISSRFGFVQGLLETAASLFTGGAAATISQLANYSKVSNLVVKDYEKRTESSDCNRFIVFDHQELACFKDENASWIAVFTGGKETLTTYAMDDDGKLDKGRPIKIKEGAILSVERIDTQLESETPTPYRFQIRTGRDENGDGKVDDDDLMTVHPDGNTAFIAVTIEPYEPYPHLREYPEQVPGIRENFEAMRDIVEKYTYFANTGTTEQASAQTAVGNGHATAAETPANEATAEASGAKTEETPETAITEEQAKPAAKTTSISEEQFHILLQQEGSKLFDNLQTLIGTGDISTRDAGIIMEAYIERAARFAPKMSRAHLDKMREFFPDLDDRIHIDELVAEGLREEEEAKRKAEAQETDRNTSAE